MGPKNMPGILCNGEKRTLLRKEEAGKGGGVGGTVVSRAEWRDREAAAPLPQTATFCWARAVTQPEPWHPCPEPEAWLRLSLPWVLGMELGKHGRSPQRRTS